MLLRHNGLLEMEEYKKILVRRKDSKRIEFRKIEDGNWYWQEKWKWKWIPEAKSVGGGERKKEYRSYI